MARDGNRYRTSYLKLSTTPQVLSDLDALVDRGLWGKTRSEVAESLMREQLRVQLLLPFPNAPLRKGPQKAKTRDASKAKRKAS